MTSSRTEFNGCRDGRGDNSPLLECYATELAARGGGTLAISDGVYGIRRPLLLPIGVSLVLQPGATLKALPDFAGEVLVETESYAPENAQWAPQVIEGGILDGSALPVIGIRTERDRETAIRNLMVRNCLRKGIHVGAEQGCEINLAHVRVQCERGVVALPDSIGIHFDKATDNQVSGAIIIGYATGLRSDSASNDFQQVHAWNYNENCRLRTCFHCNGWNDSWSQCYADSPMNAEESAYGFYVARPFNRVSNCRIYNNHLTASDKVIGIFVAAGGTHGTFIGNHFAAQSGHRMLMAFDGSLDTATILGNSYNPEIGGGRVSQVPAVGTWSAGSLPRVS